MTVTRAWWIVAGGMIIALPGALAFAELNRNIIHLGVSHGAREVFFLGLAIAAVGVVQVARTAARAFL